MKKGSKRATPKSTVAEYGRFQGRKTSAEKNHRCEKKVRVECDLP
jgi:hypothetical protein